MVLHVDEASGGPYSHEIDLIRDERHRARVLNEKPDFDRAFSGVVISPGAMAVIKDIDKPVELPVGEFVQNVVFHDEEETAPEADKAEGEPEGDKGPKEEATPVETGAEQGNTPVSAEGQSAAVVELQGVLDPVTPANDTPIYAQAEQDNHVIAG